MLVFENLLGKHILRYPEQIDTINEVLCTDELTLALCAGTYGWSAPFVRGVNYLDRKSVV